MERTETLAVQLNSFHLAQRQTPEKRPALFENEKPLATRMGAGCLPEVACRTAILLACLAACLPVAWLLASN